MKTKTKVALLRAERDRRIEVKREEIRAIEIEIDSRLASIRLGCKHRLGDHFSKHCKKCGKYFG